ncbi:Alpha beta hydrolase fold protein [Seminavis robusta]|uniref:Alpha beta hydrolase fold protein n=1 Tax=Seminavis robusta TaxID=568900 RepID=A0A9N8ECW5_9STRA|nr:Alpha beta hydrolase fold protein [Seminavis robusta]|eukprot:Sro761_g198530.1 Alpha beta hydrolase fold protein (331) ;mRNA; r:23682-24674
MTTYEDLEANFPRQRVDLPNGETLSYVDWSSSRSTATHPKHTLLLIPGYACDSKFMAFTLAQYDAFHDHRILAVDPRGYGESSLHSENWSHEENAEDMKLFLDALQIQTPVMVMGYSTGGGASAWLALLYPERVSAVWMVCALPLNGMRTPMMDNDTLKPTGVLLQSKQDAIQYTDMALTPFVHNPNMTIFQRTTQTACMKTTRLPANRGIQLYHEAALSHRSRASALYANNAFNLTPIQTPIAPPTHALSQLQCPMMVLHGSHDNLISTRQVRAVTELAMVERWAPKQQLHYYEIPHCAHMFMYDNPQAFQTVYRKALEKHIVGRASSL